MLWAVAVISKSQRGERIDSRGEPLSLFLGKSFFPRLFPLFCFAGDHHSRAKSEVCRCTAVQSGLWNVGISRRKRNGRRKQRNISSEVDPKRIRLDHSSIFLNSDYIYLWD